MALIGAKDSEKIWNYLRDKGLNEFGCAGILGNLQAESSLRADNLQSVGNKRLGMTDNEYMAAVDDGTYTKFASDSFGWGLAQWTHRTRKKKLLEYARSVNKSIGDLEMQLDFLWDELNGRAYRSTLSTLRRAISIRQASDKMMLKYERPANQSIQAKEKRARYGQAFYDEYARKKLPDTLDFTPYTVKVTARILNCRSGPGTNYAIINTMKKREKYTIVGEAKGIGASNWGELESGAGWVSLDYCKRV